MWDYDDSAEGYTCHVDRRYSVQIHQPFALNFGRDALITLMRTHPVWNGRRLRLYGLK